MQFDFTRQGLFRAQTVPILKQSELAIDVSDLGFDDGIDVVIYGEHSGRVLFETVLADPGSRTLLSFGTAQTEAFWRCLETHNCLHDSQRLFLTARCHFSLLTPPNSTRGMGRSDRRNACFLRLIEDLMDEFRTRAPGVHVDVKLTHRNPAFEGFINGPW